MRAQKRAALVAASGLGIGCLWAPPAQAELNPPTARSSTIISGLAGASTLLHLARPVSMNNAGSDVHLRSLGSAAVGIALIRVDHRQRYAEANYYVESYATDKGLCGTSPCPVPLQVRSVLWAAQDAGPVRLSAGDYVAVLLGESGLRVTAKLSLRGQPTGTLRRLAAGPQLGRLSVDTAEQAVAGHDLVMSGYHMHYDKRRMFTGNLGMFAFGSPGAVDYQNCGDIGNGPPPEGPTMCLGSGGPWVSPTVTGAVGSTVYGTGASFAYGPPDGHYGLGYTIAVGGPSPAVQRIRLADYQVVLPTV
jgi:hypothetical protein